ncbi:MAG: DUF512 domain-containing protein [Candidatus Cloacimonadaceae bacterium]
MPLIIQDILPRSLAARSGIKAGDKLLCINGHDIRDFIDLEFYGSESYLDCELEKTDGEPLSIEIARNERTPLGIEPESYQCTSCVNSCVFCFIDQMPPSLRDSLYIKDDDFLYSFVFGNYISLTNLSKADYDRIIEQKLSPLYISVHTTNPALRKELMGYEQELDIMRKLRKLSRGGIKLHFQIVVVPGYNDKEELQRTLDDLTRPEINTGSIGIVPVGLTRFRRGLSKLRILTPDESNDIISLTEEFRNDKGADYLYCADELFIRAGLPIPDCDYYQDYPQIENGIGMVCLLQENWKEKRRSLLREVRKKGKPLLLVTGTSAQSYIEEIADYVTRKAECCPARVQSVINHYMGENVSVSGLLTFADIREQIKPNKNDVIVLPGNIFNHDGITLDGFSQLEIKEYWQRDILIIDPLFDDWEWI